MPSTTSVSLKKIKRTGRNGRARYDWTLRWFQSDGVERSRKIGNASLMTKREAEKIRRHFQTEMDAARVARDKPKRMTMGQFADYHEKAVDGHVKPATLDVHRIALTQFASEVGKERLLQQVNEADIGRYCRSLRKRHASPATIRKQLATLRACFNRAVRWKLIHENPFNGQPLPRAQPKQKRIYTPDEIAAMIEVARTLWWKAFIQVAATSGLRLQETLNLQWADVDFEKGTVTVSAKRAGSFEGSDGEEYPILEWSAKSHQERVIPVPAETVAMLKGLRATSDGSPYCFLSLQRLALILARQQTGSLRRSYEVRNNMLRDFQVIQKHAATRLGLKDWRLGTVHDLRKTYGTRMAEVVPMHVLQRWMGHQDIGTTARYYLGAEEEYAERARAALRTNGQ